MAYVDTQTGNRRTATIAAVALVHAGAIYALVNGLSFVGVIERVIPISARNIPNDPPKPLPPEPSPRDTKKPALTSEIDRVVVPLQVDIGQPTLPPLPDTNRLGDAEIGFPTIDLGPVPSPTPSFTPSLARPRGNPGGWVTPLDYPASELRAEHQGVTRLRALVGADGWVKGCEIVASSGFPLLDSTACRKMADRARFDPATDSTGAKVEGTYTASIRWVIPE